MKLKKEIRIFSLILIVAFIGAFFVQAVSADNESKSWPDTVDQWAGKRDMSQYNPDINITPTKKIDKDSAKSYPGLIVSDLGDDMDFISNDNEISSSGIPEELLNPFSEIYSKYPALKDDEDLQLFIKTCLPDRYEESRSLSSGTEVYFINDTGTFTEYIVSLKSGVIISSEYISEDFLSVNKSTAIKQALLDKSSDTGVNSIKVIISEGIPVWEISTIEGSKMGVNYITTEILADRIPLKANPTEASCACAAVAIPGIAVSYIIFRRNQKEMETKL
jgi:hypothetical protein